MENNTYKVNGRNFEIRYNRFKNIYEIFFMASYLGIGYLRGGKYQTREQAEKDLLESVGYED